MAPKGWPADVMFLEKPQWEKECPPNLVQLYMGQTGKSSAFRNLPEKGTGGCAAQKEPSGKVPSIGGPLVADLLRGICKAPVQSQPSGPCKLVKICHVSDPKHPAFGQRQLCAAMGIPPGHHILDYLGVIRPESTASKTSDYIINLGHGLSIDAEVAGNEARFVNDFRGVAPKPNAEFELCLYKDNGVVRMGVWSLRPIKKGEEILVSYGKGFWKARNMEASG